MKKAEACPETPEREIGLITHRFDEVSDHRSWVSVRG